MNRMLYFGHPEEIKMIKSLLQQPDSILY